MEACKGKCASASESGHDSLDLIYVSMFISIDTYSSTFTSIHACMGRKTFAKCKQARFRNFLTFSSTQPIPIFLYSRKTIHCFDFIDEFC